ncbi:uncharacterized protein [Aristolochia californica]|uniref:uncharacterized protein n=1 Tax=Aristolochia californica TaxID=171875 RepID=UPI0035D7987E
MTVSQSSNQGDLQCDPEIERTLSKLRREAQRNSKENNLALDSPIDSESYLEEEEVMAGNRNLKELAAPDLNQQSLCITFCTSDATTTFELKFGLIHLLPTFHGLVGEDPHKHLKEYYVYFYEGLLPTDRSMIDAATGGALVDKTPEAARNLIANMAANSQKFGTRLDLPSKNVNEACGICSIVRHPTDMCPTLQEEPTKQVNAASGFPRLPQRKYDPYSNMYNMGWRDHPNLSYGNPQVNQPVTQNHPSYQQYRQSYPHGQQPGQTSNSGMSLEDIVKSLATNNLQFQWETRANIQILDNQMGQMSTAISRLAAQSSWKLPFEMVVNPRENASAIFLKSGKEVEIPVKVTPTSSEQEKEKNFIADRNVPYDYDVPKHKFPPLSDYKPVPPIPRALADSRKYEQNKYLYETFRRSECKDPGMLTIPCTLGNTRFEKAMIDLRASINVMTYSIYASLKLRPLNKIGVVIQLADRSNAYPKGIVEVVLVQVKDLIFPADFYVLDMENGDQTTILLGRPFLKASKTKIDVYSGTLTMEFDG